MPEWLVNIILGVFTLTSAITATVGGVMIAKINTAKRHAASAAVASEAAVEQVKNSHGTNLRDDIDKLTAIAQSAVDAVSEVKKDVGGLREENRNDRKATDDRINTVERALLDHLTKEQS